MKFKYIASLIGSFFLVTSAKTQQKSQTVKKETSPQVKTDADVSALPDKNMKMAKVKGGMSGKHLPGKEVSVTSYKQQVLAWKPGDLVFATQFDTEALGEMPKGWKSNGIGSVTTVEGKTGRWLKLDESTKYQAAYASPLPGNYKIEFDFIANFKDDQSTPELVLRTYKKGEEYQEPGLSFHISPNGGSAGNHTRIQVSASGVGGGEHFRSTARHLNVFEPKNGKNDPVHVVVSVQGPQVKAWLDGEKVYDLQEAIPAGVRFDRIAFETGSYGGPKTNYSYYVSNIKVTAE